MNGKKSSSRPPLVSPGLVALLAALSFLVITSGCFQGKPVHRYTLSPLAERANTGPASGPSAPPSPLTSELLVVGPVTLANYLDQSRIVLRQGATVIHTAADQQWAGELAEMIGNTLVAEMGRLLPAVSVQAYPLSAPQTKGKRVAVDILRFEGTDASAAAIEARWTIIDLEKKTILASHSTLFQIAVADDGYENLVNALSLGLARLGHEIAASLP
jgi:uncharacterized lipoprotein YmbA